MTRMSGSWLLLSRSIDVLLVPSCANIQSGAKASSSGAVMNGIRTGHRGRKKRFSFHPSF